MALDNSFSGIRPHSGGNCQNWLFKFQIFVRETPLSILFSSKLLQIPLATHQLVEESGLAEPIATRILTCADAVGKSDAPPHRFGRSVGPPQRRQTPGWRVRKNWGKESDRKTYGLDPTLFKLLNQPKTQ